MTHILKTDPAVFEAVVAGAKTYEIRFNDRGFAVGDELVLRETTHTGAEIAAGAVLEYTGREVTKTVSHVLSGYGLGEGWVILSFAGASPVAQTAPAPTGQPLTRYDLYTVTHQRRIKPMPDGRYYLASEADERQAATAAAAREAGKQEVLSQVGALLGIASAADVQSILKAGAGTGSAAPTINTQEFRDLVHAYAAYPADIKPVVAFIERHQASAIALAVQSLLTASAAVTQSACEAGKREMLDQVGALFGIGRDARTLSIIEANYRNLVRRTECLAAIEREFFMAPGEPDDEYPDDAPDEECMLNWGASPDGYVEQFRAALANRAAPAQVHPGAAHPAAAQAASLPCELDKAICRLARDRGTGLAIGPVRKFLAQHGQPQIAAAVVRGLSVGDTVEVLPGCDAAGEDFSGRQGIVRGFEMDGMSGVSVEFSDGAGLFCERAQVEFVAAAPLKGD